MTVSLQSAMSMSLTFVLVAGALVVLAATIGSLFCRTPGVHKTRSGDANH